MYAKITDDTVSKYPYRINDLRKDHSHISFPEDSLTRADIQTDYGVVEVAAVSPTDVSGHNTVEGTPTKVGSTWTQVWNNVLKDPSDVTEDEKVPARDSDDVLLSTVFTHPGHDGERCTEVDPVWDGSQWNRTYTWAADVTWLERRQDEYGELGKQLEYIVENGVAAFIFRYNILHFPNNLLIVLSVKHSYQFVRFLFY